MVFELLRRRVGSPVSYASIARDVKASPTTIIKYIQVLEALYIIFRVAPYSRNIARSILKEPKIYFCLINTNEIEEVIEVKKRDSNISKNLRYFCQKWGRQFII